MYLIKQVPEDFIVKEIPDYMLEMDGDYSYFVLKKRNYNTIDALERIAKKLKKQMRFVGFAGNKDKKAVTEQICSVKNVSREKLEKIDIKDIKITYLGKGGKPISLGDLKGNEFVITIRDLKKEKAVEAERIPNYFGEQRFSKNNVAIGRAIVQRNFNAAIKLIDSYRVKDHLEEFPYDYAGALRQFSLRLRRIYVHAYQSWIWNEMVKEYLKREPAENEKIPIIGFGTEFKNRTVNLIANKIMNREGISPRDFIIRQMPELSAEGNERDLFVTPEDFWVEFEEDGLNKGKLKAIVHFILPKGSYATEIVKHLFKDF
ncbi:tRNA pseudouridine(13) synthase TruD [Candidatus Woesearchaeota archaeon]|nr:tRNA pseudouridine(13) synthase TruD [Candidatus Woesearchaeota archaeon]